jgi:hypothetical protein
MAAPLVSSNLAVQLDQSSNNTSESFLRVTEHLPTFVSRAMPVRRNVVNEPEQALHLPWIAKLPGEKRIEPWHGRVVIMQHYLHHKLVRAQIEPLVTDPNGSNGDTDISSRKP